MIFYINNLVIISTIVFFCSIIPKTFANKQTTMKATPVRGPGYEYPRISSPVDGKKKLSPRWLIIAGRQIIPGAVYPITTQDLRTRTTDKDVPLTIRASISRDGRQVSFGKVLLNPGDLSEVLLKVPDTSVPGEWHLRVEGREGDSQLPVFKNTTLLRFSPEFLTILIQTSRPIYNGGQTVRFRAVMLTRELRPYDEPVDVYVLDPRGRKMRRWPSRQTGDGVINLSFDLPEYPLLGNWTIQIQARQQIQNKTILVELYFKPRFEVFVRLPHTFKVTDETIEGVVVANMTNWRDVNGNCSIKLQIAANTDFPIPTAFTTVHEEFIPGFVGYYPFHLPMESVANTSGTLNNIIIRVFASVGDAFGWRIHDGWALARIVKEEPKVTFLGDQPVFFKPGMPLAVHVFVSYLDNHPIGSEELENSTLVVTFRSTKTYILSINGTDLTEQGGVAQFLTTVPEDATRLDVTARFLGGSGMGASATLIGILHHSPRNRHLQIETSTHTAVPGQFIILHVRNNFYITHINYLVVANGLIVNSGREEVNEVSFPSVTTFALPAGSEMSPMAKILVWVVDQDSEVITHSISIPVSPLEKHEVKVRWNEHKDHTGGSAEVKMLGEIGAYFAASAVWEETHLMDSGHDFDAARILFHMMGFHDSVMLNTEEKIPHMRRAATRSRQGYGANVRFFPTPNAGPDAPSTFNFSEVILLTDAMIYYHPSMATDSPPCPNGTNPCLTGGCYVPAERCNGVPTCADFSDELGCIVNVDPHRNFRLYRISRLFRLYDPGDGDWGWKDVRMVEREIQVFAFPKIPQNWVYSVFAVGNTKGLGIMSGKIQFDSAGPFMLTVEGPTVARMWEQVGLRVSIFNFHHSTVSVLVTLPHSEDYQSIAVEPNGIVNSYDPRRLDGTFQHIVWLPGGASYDVHIPIIFTRMGEIEVTVKGATQMQRDAHTITIAVEPEGASIGQHTSILLDLKNRALVYEFFDIHLDETPIIPYTLRRFYVFGTPQGTVSISGDVVGPIFPEIPVNEDILLGFGVMGAETSAYNFAANLWSLHYLRLTNQITTDIRYKVLTAVNVEYAALSRYQLDTGGFSNWIGSEPSVWLTAHALKSLWVASFQDWENYIYIDTSIIESGVSFLLKFQTTYGSFTETPHYLHPLDPKVDPRSREEWMPKYQNISLTAHVVIALTSVLGSVGGELHTKATLAKERAATYLEKILHTLTDPYDLAVVTWALIKAESSQKDYAFNAFDKLKIVDGDRVYWSRDPVEFNEIIYEDSQRPYMQPKGDDKWDSHAVETTAYGLLIYIKLEGIDTIQENIVRFLCVMKKSDGGFESTIDSIVALEALVEYSFRARLRDITDMRISIEQSASPNNTINLVLTNDLGLAEPRVFDLDALYGHLAIKGRGSGQALVQLDYSYGVDVVEELDYAPIHSFDFKLTAQFTGRNNSYITLTSCQSWTNLEESETSGVAVVEIHLPSGYHIMQDELIAMVDSRKVRNLRWALVSDANVKFFFNRLDADPVCFTYQIERWYPVSNHSRYNLAQVYDLYQPERYEMKLFEVFPLYSLDICEVCGSLQCPYCPFYSSSLEVLPSLCTVILPAMLIVLFINIYNIKNKVS